MAQQTEIRTVSTDRCVMDYFSFGTGEKSLVILPGVSLHPVTESADGVAGAFSDFCRDYTVYVFDPRRDFPAEYSVEEMAKDIASVMDALGLRHAIVFGCSMGGMIAQPLAAERSDLVEKLVLASTLARQNDVSRATWAEWVELADRGDVRALNRSIRTHVYSPAYQEQYRDIFAALEGQGTETEMRLYRNVVHAFQFFDFYDRLGEIRCPTTVIGSRGDRTLGWVGSEELAAALGCPLIGYDGYGHAVYDEAPEYRPRLLSLLAE